MLSASLGAESSKGFTELSGILIRPIKSRKIDHLAIQFADSIPISVKSIFPAYKF
jgi:hypothetical protein